MNPRVLPLPIAKLPPQALATERSVLGVALLHRDRRAEILGIIKSPEIFYADTHQRIYTAIQTLDTKGSTVDILTVTEELRRAGDLEQVGGPHEIVRLTFDVTHDTEVKAHAHIILQKWMSREIIRVAGMAMQAAYEDAEDVFDQLEKTEAKFSAITDIIRTGTIKHMHDVLLETVRAMKEARYNPDGMIGLPTGNSKLDSITKGMQNSNLIILAAGPGEGKTTFALNTSEFNARAGTPIGFISLEMRDRELIRKIISKHIREDVKSVMSGNFSDGKWQMLEKDMRKLMSLPIYIYDKGGLNITELKAIARTMVKKHKIKLLTVDYLQLVRGIPGKRYGTREEEVNEVSKSLKALAMDLDIPIIALSQNSRMEKGVKRMYELYDLRDSGAIEQDANCVWFIYRPVVHKVADFEGRKPTEFDAWLNIAKDRSGETGKFRMRFDGAFNQFTDSDDLEFSGHTPAIAAARHAIDYSAPRSEQFDEEEEEDDTLPF